MTMEVEGNSSLDEPNYLEHSAFPTNLPSLEVLGRFWTELRMILPANELHVVDPYVLHAGQETTANYAAKVTALLKPALRDVKRVVFVHSKSGDEVRDLLKTNIGLVNTTVDVQFQKGTVMHPRYLVADRARALRMDFSFNGISKSFGTVSVVESSEDLAGILGELERLHPLSSN